MDKLNELEAMRDYIPTRLRWENGVPSVDWAYCDETRYREAFFEATLETAMSKPFNLLFGRNTPIEFLAHLSEISPGIKPSGFIYHVSRCGSTLVSSLLGKLDEAIILSEPSPLDAVLRARFLNPAIQEETQIEWIRGMVSALAQKKEPQQSKLFIKLDAWHLIFHEQLRKAFPETPAIFMYRDPVEVMVSTVQQRASFLVPTIVPSALFGVPFLQAVQMPQEEYCAIVLSQFYRAGLQYSKAGAMMPVNYTEMPEATWEIIPDHFGLDLSSERVTRLKASSTWNPKSRMTFEPDSTRKRKEANELTRQCSERLLYPAYNELEELRANTHQARPS